MSNMWGQQAKLAFGDLDPSFGLQPGFGRSYAHPVYGSAYTNPNAKMAWQQQAALPINQAITHARSKPCPDQKISANPSATFHAGNMFSYRGSGHLIPRISQHPAIGNLPGAPMMGIASPKPETLRSLPLANADEESLYNSYNSASSFEGTLRKMHHMGNQMHGANINDSMDAANVSFATRTTVAKPPRPGMQARHLYTAGAFPGMAPSIPPLFPPGPNGIRPEEAWRFQMPKMSDFSAQAAWASIHTSSQQPHVVVYDRPAHPISLQRKKSNRSALNSSSQTANLSIIPNTSMASPTAARPVSSAASKRMGREPGSRSRANSNVSAAHSPARPMSTAFVPTPRMLDGEALRSSAPTQSAVQTDEAEI